MFDASIFDSSYPLPLAKLYTLISQAGFSHVMLGWRDDNRREKPGLARNAGLQIENIHAPFVNADAMWLEGLTGDGYVERLLACITDCRQYGIPTMVVHLLNESDAPPPSKIGTERLKRLAEQAERCGINIAFENTYAPDLIRHVFDQVPCEQFGFCFDSGHQNCMTPDRDLLEEFGGRLMALHLNDNDGPPPQGESPQQADQHLLPFDGSVDWEKTAKQLAEIGYKGPIAFEVSGWKEFRDEPERFYQAAFDRATRLHGMMYPHKDSMNL